MFSLMFFVQAMGFFFGHGSGNYISRELGARRHENAIKMASTGFFSSFLVGVIVLILGEIFLTPLSLMLEVHLPFSLTRKNICKSSYLVHLS